MSRRKLSNILLSGGLVLMLAGCSYLNKDEDERVERLTNPTPSPHGMLSDIQMKPAAPYSMDSGSAGTPGMETSSGIKDDFVLEPNLYEKVSQWGSLGSKDLGTDAIKTPEKRFNALAFEAVFKDKDPSQKVKIDIKFDNTNLVDVLPAFSKVLGFDYVMDPALQSTVTMTMNTELTLADTWSLVQQLVWMGSGFCDYRDGMMYIRPLNKISNEYDRPDSNIQVQVVTILNQDAGQLNEQLKPFLSDQANSMVMAARNALLLVDTPTNMERLVGIISELDKRYKEGWYTIVIQCDKVSASKIKTELMQIFPVLGFNVTEGGAANSTPGAIHLTSVDRLQILVASAASPEPLTEMRSWVSQLNTADQDEQERLYIYKVINSKADRLLRTIAVMFNIDGRVLKTNDTMETVAGSALAENQKPNNVFEQPVKVFADVVDNRLLFRTTERTYGIIRALLNRLDTIPPQVLLQVMVVEIELTDTTEFGMEFSMEPRVGGQDVNMGTNYPELTPGPVQDVGSYGGKLFITDPNNENQFLFLKALAGRSKMKVLSSPQILVVSNTEAMVDVGSRVPIITGEITDTQSSGGDNTAVKRSIDYTNTGVILKATPSITGGGLISLSLSQEISEAMTNTTSGIASPIIKQDQLKTTLMIRSGRTIIMGGLIKEKHDENVNSIPGIADIPWLNWLTGNSTSELTRTEILVLVTASLINEYSTLEDMIRRYNEAVWEVHNFENNVYKDLMHQQAHPDSMFDITQSPISPASPVESATGQPGSNAAAGEAAVSSEPTAPEANAAETPKDAAEKTPEANTQSYWDIGEDLGN